MKWRRSFSFMRRVVRGRVKKRGCGMRTLKEIFEGVEKSDIFVFFKRKTY